MTSRVYFIGAGPGDPDLLTLKGARVLAGCPNVFAPTPYEVTFAALLAGKTVRIPFDFYFAELLGRVEDLLRAGDVAFLVPGDLTFYSPFQALIDILGERAEVVPGVSTANAAAARLKKTFDRAGVGNRAILTSPRVLAEDPAAPSLRELAAPGATLVLFMNNLPLPELVAQLRSGFGKNVPIAILHRLGLPGEEVVAATLDDIEEKVGDRDFFALNTPKKRPALTLVVVGETLAARADSAWWDLRRDKVWKGK